MMLTKEQQHYLMIEQRRKAALYQRYMQQRQSQINARLSFMAQFIAFGGAIEEHPEYQEEYNYLIGEFGEGVFESEVKKYKLMMENGEL